MKWFELLRERYNCPSTMLHVPYQGGGRITPEMKLRGRTTRTRRHPGLAEARRRLGIVLRRRAALWEARPSVISPRRHAASPTIQPQIAESHRTFVRGRLTRSADE